MIDLGVLPHEPAAPSAEPPPPPRARLRAWRPFALTLAAVLLATVTAGGRLTPPDRPLVIPAAAGDATLLGGEHYFVVSGQEPTRLVSTYALADGALLSRTPLAVAGALTDLRLAGGVLVVSHQADLVGGEATVGLDTRTGGRLWRHPARLTGFSPDGLVLLLDQPGSVGAQTWTAARPRDGVVAWQHVVPPAAVTELAPGGRVVTAEVTGRVEIRDADTGRVTAAAQVPAQRQWRDGGINMWADHDLLLLGGPDGIDAYDLGTLVARWHRDTDLSRYFVLPQCGDALCLFGRFGGLQVLDPATGRSRWSAERWGVAERVGAYMLASLDSGPVWDRPLVVLDAATGDPRGTLGAWQPVGEPLPGGRIVAVRQTPADRQVRYAVIDPATVSVRLLGVADGVAGRCAATTDRLVCRREDATVGVWPLVAP
ncbi:outer membrane protein assembly factor BamB family protein [Spirilliplanes yamanashiensis]|uniref:Pyrrolo-quinoline quinone repeat domain-containing protein n=1 Tax=Spirilliplanes yamanashiensis TaxID=42233 RepID=A0A8J3Y5B2_9ACTN|nr:PQQ-binding-like beta-propeller repeat protein [Spirilliplanes yamanashiensis]MDP9819504.1 hypothetical protein [Spirilliplanes yamanashiensis]GIJ01674.1 hypothetical protein Sya03_10260 [Spirilliplanes yamanashiensis]